MTAFGSRFIGLPLLLVLLTLGCGSGRHLQGVTVHPSVATAQNGQAQFSAIGTFSEPPSPLTLTSTDVTWCTGELTSAPNASPQTCIGNVAPFATVDQNGSATCNPALPHGTGYILAGTDQMTLNPDGGSQFRISGYARLTCP